MSTLRILASCIAAVTLGSAAEATEQPARAQPLRIVMIDAEGGAASLFVTPEGESLLVDTGWGSAPSPPPTAERIVAAAHRLGLSRIDYVLITHYHADHVGGVQDLLAKIKVGTFIDHGPNREQFGSGAAGDAPPGHPVNTFPRYLKAIAGHARRSVRAGDVLKIGSMELTFVASDGVLIDKPLPGAGGTTAHCDVAGKGSGLGGEENDRSLGFVATFGKTRILDLGDLTWDKEKGLVCPENRIGAVGLLLVSHHGSQMSNSPPLIAAAAPRVALVANGARKGGDASVFATLADAASHPAVWQLHATTREPDANRPQDYIANPGIEPDGAHALDIAIHAAGDVQVTNTRNGYAERYSR